MITEIRTWGGTVVRVVVTCEHDDLEPVRSIVTDELLAWLCPACDQQLPPEWHTVAAS